MKILIPTDGSDLSTRAIDAGVALARALGATVVGMTALPPYAYAGYADYGQTAARDEGDYAAEIGAIGNERLAVVERAARAAAVPCELVVQQQHPPYRAVLDCALQRDCSLIVMASHGRGGIGAMLLGSETQKVLAHADRPVLVVR